MIDFEGLEKRARLLANSEPILLEYADAIRQLRQERDEEREERKKARASWHARRDDLGREIASQRAVIAELKEALRPFAEAARTGRISFADPDFQMFDEARAALARLEPVSDFGQSPLDRLHDAD